MTVIRHVICRGRVQGVGYRAWVMETALRLGLEGWVRNRRDGSVEAVFSGTGDVVHQMIEACRQGPSAARLEGVDVADGDADTLSARRPGERFSILHTV